VVVGRAGDVIPQVVSAIPDLRCGDEKQWEMPELCSACGMEISVVRENNADIARCLNSLCPGQVRLIMYFLHYVLERLDKYLRLRCSITSLLGERRANVSYNTLCRPASMGSATLLCPS
jgi:hypothetical protein